MSHLNVPDDNDDV